MSVTLSAPWSLLGSSNQLNVIFKPTAFCHTPEPAVRKETTGPVKLVSLMAKHRTHSIEFKRQVAQEFLAGETLHGVTKRHDICRNLIRVWVQKYEAGAFDEDAAAAAA